jgi:hypothetical protein
MSDQKGQTGGIHLSKEQITKYSTKLLKPHELLTVDQHLADCSDCRARLPVSFTAIGESLPEEFMQTDEEEHLTYEQIVEYIENKDAATRGQVALHLKACARCDEELNDLKTYAKEFEAKPFRTSVSNWFFAAAAVLAMIAIAAALYFQRKEPQRAIVRQPVRTLVSLNEPGTHIIVDQNGKLSGLEGAPETYQDMVLAAIQNRMVETPTSLQQLIGKTGFVRGDERSTPFQVLTPVGTFVADDKPIFQWERLSGASKYKVTILDEDLNMTAQSPWIQNTSWKAENALQRDRTYIWQVAALRNGVEIVSPQPPAPDARFSILNQKESQQLKNDIEKYPSSNLLIGLLYAQHGVLDEAAKHLQMVSDANPKSMEIKQLLKNLQKLRS